MRYYIPDIKLASELPQQKKFQEKLGGIPWGLSEKEWPKCKECHKSQSLLAQFLHHPERMDLGKEGRVLNIFMCNQNVGGCSSWDAESGANACFVTESEEMQKGLSTIPADNPPIEKEARITKWKEKEDKISEKDAKAFYNDKYYDLEEEKISKVSSITRLGGVPSWIQTPADAPARAIFIGQLSTHYNFFKAPKEINKIPEPQPPEIPQKTKKRSIVRKLFSFFRRSKKSKTAPTPMPAYDPNAIYEHKKVVDGCTHYTEGPNFGDCGMGYIFIKKSKGKPKGYFFWQCS